MSWEFNPELYMFGLAMDKNSDFAPTNEQTVPTCAPVQDSNNADHCAQYNEFGRCKLCNSAYKLENGVCKLSGNPHGGGSGPQKDQDGITLERCSYGGEQGWTCPSDHPPTCYTAPDVGCATLLPLFAANNIPTNCSSCSAASTAEKTRLTKHYTRGKTLRFNDKYYAMQYKKEIVAKAKAQKFEAASPLPHCAEGETEELANGVLVCHTCEPGFENSDEACTALPDPQNCAQVEFSNPKRMCIACNAGFELSDDPEDEDC